VVIIVPTTIVIVDSVERLRVADRLEGLITENAGDSTAKIHVLDHGRDEMRLAFRRRLYHHGASSTLTLPHRCAPISCANIYRSMLLAWATMAARSKSLQADMNCSV
jgi:hypothetical protein